MLEQALLRPQSAAVAGELAVGAPTPTSGLGFRADEARRAAALCEPIPNAPMEERVRLALSYFAKPSHTRAARILLEAR